jgi:predicted RNA-binding protein YlxR (DUF448 family)
VAPKPELVRLAAVPATAGNGRFLATLDRAGTLPGRGAYLCLDTRRDLPNGECATQASKRGGLQRAFRRAVEVPSELAGSLESHTRVAQPDASPASRAPRLPEEL